MKKIATLSFLLAGTVLASSIALAAEVPVDRVILSTSGLAHFEHHAAVDGNATVQFPVRLEQVDDILKSLIVFDKKGHLGSVTLPGRQPLQQVFKDLPFSQAQLSDPMLLLNAYQGAEVTVQDKQGAVTGDILRVAPEETALEDGTTVTRHRLSLMTGDGLRQRILEDMQSLRFTNEKIRGEISRALAAIRENGTSGNRLLTVNLPGVGKRDVAMSYVVDAPLWKTAYRMVVPETGKEEGLLQGWAVVENLTAGDWKNVDLTLVSGNPVTYRQNLYPAYYVDRPEIPVQVFGRVMPRVDQGAIATAAEMESDAVAPRVQPLMKARAAKSYELDGAAMGALAAAPAMPMAMESMAYNDAVSSDMASVAGAASAAQSAEATTQVLFRFPDRFDLKSGQSMMLPFVSRSVPMERVALYQPETNAQHPLAAVLISNDGETGLPPGILTLYEESALLKGTSFVGDAQMPVIGAGEERMISYALDSKTKINREDKNTSTEDKITISQGVMNTAVKNVAETVYTIKAPAQEDRLVVIEHPKMYNYEIVSPDPKDVEVTADRYRLRVAVKAGEKKTLPVRLESQIWQSVGIDSLPAEDLLAYATSRGRLDPAMRRVFEKLAGIRREMDGLDQQIRMLEQERRTIFQDQERVRENLKSLAGKSDVQQKYLEKLNDQEDRIATIDKEANRLAVRRREKQAELQKEIAGMAF